jgi:hypothetical protein
VCAVALAACGSDALRPADVSTRVRVLNAFSGVPALDVFIDGSLVLSDVPFAQVSNAVRIAAGAHTVSFQPVGALADVIGKTFTLSEYGDYTLAAIDSSTVINPIVLTDTGAAPVAGKSKMRVVHFAAHAPPIDVWRTQPDYPDFVRVMFPFAYRAASSYLQSDPGVWTVRVTREGTSEELYSSGPISIGAGEVRTLVLLDAPDGGIQAQILDH